MADLPLTIPDLVCWDDLDTYGAETTSDLQTLAQDLYHVLVEGPGSNPDDPEAGVGIAGYLSCDEAAFRGLPGRIDTQFERDDRVTDSRTTVVKDDGGFRVQIIVNVGGEILPLSYLVTDAGVRTS